MRNRLSLAFLFSGALLVACSDDDSFIQRPSGGLPAEVADKAELETLKKFHEDTEDKALHEVAKRYAIIGKTDEELFPVLKSLKAAGGTSYDDMIAVLDSAVETVEKSGAFTEIGKSGGQQTDGAAWAKADAKAAEIMKSNNGVTKAQALDMVFQSDPELAAECEKED